MSYTSETVCLLFCARNIESRVYVTSIRNWNKFNKITYQAKQQDFNNVRFVGISSYYNIFDIWFDRFVLSWIVFIRNPNTLMLYILSFIEWISINLCRIAFFKETFFQQNHICQIVCERERQKSLFLHSLFFWIFDCIANTLFLRGKNSFATFLKIYITQAWIIFTWFDIFSSRAISSYK